MTSFNIQSEDIESGKTMAGISYFGIIGFVIALITSRENKFVMYHAQQAIIPTILFIVRYFPGTPFFFDSIFSITAVVLFVIGIINGFGGKVQPLPLLGELAYNFGLCKPE